jgi:hypothetical protein
LVPFVENNLMIICNVVLGAEKKCPNGHICWSKSACSQHWAVKLWCHLWQQCLKSGALEMWVQIGLSGQGQRKGKNGQLFGMTVWGK